MESIPQIIEKFIKKVMSIDLTVGLTETIIDLQEQTNNFACLILKEKLNQLDEVIFHGTQRKGWNVEHKGVPRELLTQFGMINFNRRYYKNKISNERKYLLDDLVGIERSERIETGLAAKLCEKATDMSYAKSSDICCDGLVSRQTVMRKTRQVNDYKLDPKPVREDVKVVHIQADEDHVAMQYGGRDKIVKLVVIHEPAQRVSKNRYKLPQKHIMSSYQEDVEDFWVRVADRIEEIYGDTEKLKIYLHGDGASWIRSGTQWLTNCYFVLDKFHVSKYMRTVTGGNIDYMKYIWGCFEEDERKKINDLVDGCMGSEICTAENAKKFKSYIRNNWDGIMIWYDPKHEVGSSCAEGQVSHILSSRLSSRPRGWRDEGLTTISNLRVHVLNGGRIKPENLRKSARRPVIRATKTLKKAVGCLGDYDITEVFSTIHRSSSRYRMFKGIKEGGRIF